MNPDHKKFIDQILAKEFGQSAIRIERIAIGLCNEVYSVSLPEKSVILRMNIDDSEMRGSEKFIPIFKSLGIKVPDIIASNYSKKLVPFAYQILTKIEGEDIGQVIHKLTDEQLEGIAKEVVIIFRKLESIPTNGKFGWFGIDENKLFATLSEALENMIKEVKERNEKTEIVGDNFIKTMQELVAKYRNYFSAVKSTCYFGDICTKNVMIKEGKFMGLVDLDGVEYGDPLEAVGRIKASWFGTHYGDFYTNAIQKGLGLNKEQIKMVTVYAVLNHIYWLSEKGIQFNQNTSLEINQEEVGWDKKAIGNLVSDLQK